MSEPAATYPVIGDLLATARSFRQVLDQLARAHIDNRVLAYDDAGDQAAGATSALAAADELHQAGTLLDTVEWRLDAASQHSGRIAWHPAAPELARTTAHVGTLTLTVWPDEPVGEHQRYAYRIEDAASGRRSRAATYSPASAPRSSLTGLCASWPFTSARPGKPGTMPSTIPARPRRTRACSRSG